MDSWSDKICILTRLLGNQIFASWINLSSDNFSNQIFLSIFKYESGHFPSLNLCLLEANDMPFRLIRLNQYSNKTSFSCRAIEQNWFGNVIQNNKDHYFNYISRFCWCLIFHFTICDRYAPTLPEETCTCLLSIIVEGQALIWRQTEFPHCSAPPLQDSHPTIKVHLYNGKDGV